MNYLKKLTDKISEEEYLMYQEIPERENGSVNNLRASKKEFNKLLKERLKEEYLPLDDVNTPRITYIMYSGDKPVGEVMIRPVLNYYWYNTSGNIGYKIRPSRRGEGLGNEILRLALEEAKNLGLSSVRLGCFVDNKISEKVILKNGGKQVNEMDHVKYFNISLGE